MSRKLGFKPHICHACGQHMSQPSEGNGTEFLARPYYETYEHDPRDRTIRDSSGLSDSGYGSSFSDPQDAGSRGLQLGGGSDTHLPSTTLPDTTSSGRSPTYTDSIYSSEVDLESKSPLDTPKEPERSRQTPELQHGSPQRLPPRAPTTTRSRCCLGPRSRYARLNELPAASPGTSPLDDGMESSIVRYRDDEAGKKRVLTGLRSLFPRVSSSSSFRRLDFCRVRHNPWEWR